MADSTGVQVFVGPANQLELGTVEMGESAAATLETVSDRLQRLNLTIPGPTVALQDAVDASAADASAAATSAAGAQTAAETAASNAAASKNAATTAATNAATAATTAQTALGSADTAVASATAAQAAAVAAIAQAAAAAPTDAQLQAIVQTRLLPSNLSLDTDGVPYINPGANSVVVLNDTDGRPYFV